MKVRVVSGGFLSTVQDLGRVGGKQSGVSTGGALDWHGLRVVNVLVNNPEIAAGLEVTMGNVRLRFEDERVVAWSGGAFAVRIDQVDLPAGHAGLVMKDEELLVGAAKASGRGWLAISGGIEVPPVLGSRSTDLRGGFGGLDGRALRDGDWLPLGDSNIQPARLTTLFAGRKIAPWTAPSAWVAPVRGRHVLRIIRGQHWSFFTEQAQSSLLEEPFRVSADSDRMGARLAGPGLSRVDSTELLSEAVAPGTIQVPPNGDPILLLGDCQTIGGYPRIAHVITVDLPIAAQLGAGDTVRFHEVTLAEAERFLCEREEDFVRFRTGIGLSLR